MSKIPEFTDLSTQVMNLSNNCNFGYYYKAFGATTQSISGAMDMTISLSFCAFMDDNTDLNAGIADTDDTVVGTWTGVFIKSFFVGLWRRDFGLDVSGAIWRIKRGLGVGATD